MEIGARIRQIRTDKNLTVSEVAEKSGFTPGYISQLERDLANPSLGALKKVAEALGVLLSAFFEVPEPQQPDDQVVVRANRRRILSYPGSGIQHQLLSPPGTRDLEFMLVVVPPGVGTGEIDYVHKGEECALVLSGEVEFYVNSHRYVLKEGDSIQYPSTEPHRWVNLSDQEARLVWINTPSTF